MVRHWRRALRELRTPRSTRGRRRHGRVDSLSTLRRTGPRRFPRGRPGSPPSPATIARERRSAKIGLVINSVGAAMTRLRAAHRHRHEVHARRLARVHRDPDPRDAHDRREPLLPRRRARDRVDDTPTSAPRATSRSCSSNRLQKPVLKAIDYALAAKHDKTIAVHVAVSDEESDGAPAAVGGARDPGAARHHRVAVPLVRHPRRAVHQAVPREVRLVGRDRLPAAVHRRATGGSRCCTTAAPAASRNQLMLVHGVSITLVPWLLDSSELIYGRRSRPLPGQQRAGLPDRAAGARRTCHAARRATRPAERAVTGGTSAPAASPVRARLVDFGT